jgi:hypothetical protein
MMHRDRLGARQQAFRVRFCCQAMLDHDHTGRMCSKPKCMDDYRLNYKNQQLGLQEYKASVL